MSTMSSKLQIIGGIIVLLPILIFILVFFEYETYGKADKLEDVRGWTPTEATLEYASKTRSGARLSRHSLNFGSESISLKYAYVYGGKEYFSQSMGNPSKDEQRALESLLPIPAPGGLKMMCYVNPMNPWEAVLFNGEDGAVSWWVYVIYPVLAFVFTGLVLSAFLSFLGFKPSLHENRSLNERGGPCHE